ncbi:putative D,D-dipeptide transport system permease protein DdpB [Cnuibacter physcomitrellae]|uniref:Peptide ABC transporter permease n=1 Tax=Cnuibacter physcomitrellae TaxID=1619308 RepID=A0A1X9LFC2_9MICO|nr:ABC transporter permease [Cnuibacter physcomitrellae]ARJ03906.1 peptide ABC transporter permease [Cnuibacter physcomitrellae]GGI39780.1 putative D,D-dipeptide transport system permease protein DdpB [Cnuibacter physcomitrellae]
MSRSDTAVRSPRQRGGRAAHPFLRYALRRVITSLLLVVGVTLVTFILTNLVPGDPVAAALGQRAAEDPAIVAQFRAQYGLDQPLVVQYFTYLGNLLHGDLGVSTTTHNPVASDLAKALPATLEIAIGAIVLSVIIGVVLGTIAAHRRGKASDHVLRVVSLAGLSVPTFWLALVLYYVFYFQLHIAPGSGRLSSDYTTPPTVTGMYTVDALLVGQLDTFLDAMAHLFLPVLVLTLYTVGLLTRFVRTAVLEVLDQDYVRAARAKGLPGRTVIWSYVLRGASIPILTVVGLAFGSLLSGTVLVEAIFAWPGIGSYAYQAASHLDLPGVMGVGLLIGVMYLLVNLVVDLLYGVLDPRVRLAS